MKQKVDDKEITLKHVCRRVIDKSTKNWIRTDPIWLAEKYIINSSRKFQPVDKSKIKFRK